MAPPPETEKSGSERWLFHFASTEPLSAYLCEGRGVKVWLELCSDFWAKPSPSESRGDICIISLIGF